MSSQEKLSIPLQKSNLPVDESWSYTNVDVSKFKHIWSIRNFSFCLAVKEICSHPLSIVSDDKITCVLNLFPRGKKDDEGYVSLFLTTNCSSSKPVVVKVKFFILNAKKEETHFFEYEKEIFGSTCYGYYKLLKRDYLFANAQALLPKDKLTIVCELSVLGKWSRIKKLNKFKAPACKLPDDLDQLFEDPKFSDVVLTASGKEFKVHKNILAARSPVFAAMFEHPMEENKNSRVEIHDVNNDVLEELLRFIYTGKVKNLELMAEELFAASDKYALGRLKTMCEEIMYRKLSVSNAANVLILADLHSSKDLKMEAVVFIAKHASEVHKTDGWNSIVTSHPHLMAEAFVTLAHFEPKQEC